MGEVAAQRWSRATLTACLVGEGGDGTIDDTLEAGDSDLGHDEHLVRGRVRVGLGLGVGLGLANPNPSPTPSTPMTKVKA